MTYLNCKFLKHILQQKKIKHVDAHRERSLDQPLLEMMQVSLSCYSVSLSCYSLPIWVLHTMPFYRRSQGQNLASPYLKDFLYVLQNKCESKIWYGHLIQFSLQIKMRYHISRLWHVYVWYWIVYDFTVGHCMWIRHGILHIKIFHF